MDAGGFDLFERNDGAPQFTLKCSLESDLLGKLGCAEIVLVEKLEAQPAALRQSLGCQLQPQLVEIGLGDQDSGPAVS